MATPQTGLLIIRAWVEDESTERLRAHVQVTDDLETGVQRTVTLIDTDTVGQLVDDWLQRILGAPVPNSTADTH